MTMTKHDLFTLKLAPGVSRQTITAAGSEALHSLTTHSDSAFTVQFETVKYVRVVTAILGESGWSIASDVKVDYKPEKTKRESSRDVVASNHGRFHFREGTTPTSWGLTVEAWSALWDRRHADSPVAAA